MDFSMGASALVTTPGITDKEADVEVRPDLNLPPPLMCGEHECPPKDRSPGFPSGDAGWPVEDPGWWFGYWYDLDSDGMDDRLQRIIAGERESVSTTSITGADGLATVAIVVDYSWQPGPTSILAIKEVLHEHGWSEEGSWFDVLHILDSIVIDHVPVSSLIDIWNLEGVVMIEEQNVLVPLLDNAPRGSKVRDSDIFDETMRDFGYDGSGVVIAILDTGVDNEHFSLDDFSDNNNDNEKEPDELADPKWIGGCDATSWNSQDCDDGNNDPDDGDGHGTHVAGIALGTGDERRINQGYAPGSYLVDVKVMSDAGATNSAATLRGIQWVIDNVDHDWGNNESSEGIDVMSMSFGSGSDPQGDDPGDNGSNAEARAVDEAADAGIVPVAAIGNDGRRRITSVGAADSAITVGAIDDENTIERGDDMIESYSNSGPREDDGDENEWEELKPTVVAPGSNIMSAQHAASSSSIPGAPKPLAEDSYTQMTGTSMSAPAVAGFVAVMLQIDDSVDPQEVKDLLQNNSETRGSASQPSITDNSTGSASSTAI
jgi:subtilisin family serine protease